MTRLLRYAYYRLRYPGSRRFTAAGMGIEARRGRCRGYWERHYALCREFLRRYLSGAGAAAILGPGRLHDADPRWLAEHFPKVALFDADPCALRSAARLLRGVGELDVRLTDLTGVMRAWERGLAEQLPSTRRLADREERLATWLEQLDPPCTTLPQRYDTVLSLNLLGQIPLYWSDCCHEAMARHWGMTADAQGRAGSERVRAALEHSMGRLQRRHLELLARSGAAEIVLLTDVRYYYYRCDVAEWSMEPALFFEGEPQIEGYRCEARDAWLWHVAPQHLEDPEVGAIHEVAALYWRKNAVTPAQA